MRAYINAILAFIGSASLNDEEWEMITLTVPELSKALYDEMIIVLASREMVSTEETKLAAYFTAKGVDIGAEPSQSDSNIFLGAPLC